MGCLPDEGSSHQPHRAATFLAGRPGRGLLLLDDGDRPPELLPLLPWCIVEEGDDPLLLLFELAPSADDIFACFA